MIIRDSERNTTSEVRRKAILEITLTCFASKGFTETTAERREESSAQPIHKREPLIHRHLESGG